MIYSHSYEDPDTGELVDVMVDEDGGEAYRNARPREHRGNSGRRPPGFGRGPRNPFGHQHGGGNIRPAPRPRDPGQTMIVRPRPTRPVSPQRPDVAMTYDDGEFFAIKKSVLAELIPAAGQVWASLLAPRLHLVDAPL